MRRKGQGAIEFTMLTAIMLLIFSVGIIVAEKRFISLQNQQFEEQIYDILYELEEEIELAAIAGTGFSRNITISSTLGGLDYTLALHDAFSPQKDALVMTIDGDEYFIFVSEPITGSIAVGQIHQLDGGSPVTITPQ